MPCYNLNFLVFWINKRQKLEALNINSLSFYYARGLYLTEEFPRLKNADRELAYIIFCTAFAKCINFRYSNYFLEFEKNSVEGNVLMLYLLISCSIYNFKLQRPQNVKT